LRTFLLLRLLNGNKEKISIFSFSLNLILIANLALPYP